MKVHVFLCLLLIDLKIIIKNCQNIYLAPVWLNSSREKVLHNKGKILKTMLIIEN